MIIQRGTADCYCINVASNVTGAPADSTTYYFGSLGAFAVNPAFNRIYIPKTGVVTKIYIGHVVAGTAGTSENSTVYFRLNNTTDTSIVTTVDSSSSTSYYNNTALSIAVSADDFFELKWITPAWATNPTSTYLSAQILIE